MAEIMRTELARPGDQIVSPETYDQLFTMHGTIMLLFFATPLFVGFANCIMPLQIGAPDVAFPRLNMFSYWLFLFGGIIMMSGFLTPGGAADFGWFAYSPLSSSLYSPGAGADLWIMGLALSGFGTILGGVNFVTTIICLRAPGMTMFRMPIFTWNILFTSILVLVAFPVLAAALFALEADRKFGAHIFDPNNGGAILWQHLFWFFGHPEVYIVALPFFGIISEVIPVFSRKPLFGYKGLVFATISISGLSITVWAHHMFSTGAVLLPFFSLLSFLIAVPTGVKFFNWIGTMWRGSISFDTAMLFATLGPTIVTSPAATVNPQAKPRTAKASRSSPIPARKARAVQVMSWRVGRAGPSNSVGAKPKKQNGWLTSPSGSNGSIAKPPGASVESTSWIQPSAPAYPLASCSTVARHQASPRASSEQPSAAGSSSASTSTRTDPGLPAWEKSRRTGRSFQPVASTSSGTA